MIKAIVFDFFYVLEHNEQRNADLLSYIKTELKPKYKIGLISNSSGRGIRQLLTDDDLKLFDGIIVSGEVGVLKPDPKIYQLAAQKLDTAPDQCIFTDDSPQNCDGAQKADMSAIVYKDFSQFKTELEKLLSTPDN